MQSHGEPPLPEERLAELRGLGLTFVALVAATYCLAAYAAVSALPSNPLRLPLEKSIRAVRWIPQGWSFFTRNPREEQLHLFVRDAAGDWREASLGPVSDPRNAFGLNRRVRAQGVAAAFLLASVRESSWVQCDEFFECVDELPVAATVRAPGRTPMFEGLVALVKKEPVPWAWFAGGRVVNMPCRAVVVRVEGSKR